MSKIRNAVAVLILCLIGGLGYHHLSGKLHLPGDQDQLKDSLAQNAATPTGRHGLTLSNDDQDQLKDALAESPALPPNGFGGNHPDGFDNGNFHGSNQPSRGNTDGGINPGGRYDYVPQQQQQQQPQPLSPSGPHS